MRKRVVVRTTLVSDTVLYSRRFFLMSLDTSMSPPLTTPSLSTTASSDEASNEMCDSLFLSLPGTVPCVGCSCLFACRATGLREIACVSCRKLYHASCVWRDDSDVAADGFVCPQCRPTPPAPAPAPPQPQTPLKITTITKDTDAPAAPKRRRSTQFSVRINAERESTVDNDSDDDVYKAHTRTASDDSVRRRTRDRAVPSAQVMPRRERFTDAQWVVVERVLRFTGHRKKQTSLVMVNAIAASYPVFPFLRFAPDATAPGVHDFIVDDQAALVDCFAEIFYASEATRDFASARRHAGW
jgi:hypothetical protein